MLSFVVQQIDFMHNLMVPLNNPGWYDFSAIGILEICGCIVLLLLGLCYSV